MELLVFLPFVLAVYFSFSVFCHVVLLKLSHVYSNALRFAVHTELGVQPYSPFVHTLCKSNRVLSLRILLWVTVPQPELQNILSWGKTACWILSAVHLGRWGRKWLDNILICKDPGESSFPYSQAIGSSFYSKQTKNFPDRAHLSEAKEERSEHISATPENPGQSVHAHSVSLSSQNVFLLFMLLKMTS